MARFEYSDDDLRYCTMHDAIEHLGPGGYRVEVRGLLGLWPRFGLYVDGERFKVFWGWTAVHATVRAVRYARERGL
jgi:hypothetical protein